MRLKRILTMSDADKMIAILKQKTEEAWKEESPYMLSYAGPEFTDAGIDYRAALGTEKLKDFVDRTGADAGYQLVRHPTQRAKLGLIPVGKSFKFEDLNEDAGVTTQGGGTEPRRGTLLLAFLETLSRLPREDQDEIVIPTRVLVKLARKQ